MALSRKRLNGYDKLLREQEGLAAEYTRKRLNMWMSQNPKATVAEVRDFAIQAVDEAVMAYGDAASTIAADLYDLLADQAGRNLRRAGIDTGDFKPYIEEEAHYQARHLVDGAPTEFVKRMARAASDQVARRANRTMRRNAARDGIRYARVPMGGETCTFCAMLASRGYAYLSRASAGGEGDHYHPNCRCKVVPETAGDVEGYDPDEWADIWNAMEEVDNDPRLTTAQKLEVKRRISSEGMPAPAAIRYLNRMDDLYGNVQKVPPLDGYEDVCIHSNGLTFSYTDSDTESWHDMTPKVLADSLRASPGYKGGNIRLISCWAGRNGDDSPAQILANELGVKVLAPTGKAMVDKNGVMHLANDSFAFFKIDIGTIDEQGEWIVFEPRW